MRGWTLLIDLMVFLPPELWPLALLIPSFYCNLDALRVFLDVVHSNLAPAREPRVSQTYMTGCTAEAVSGNGGEGNWLRIARRGDSEKVVPRIHGNEEVGIELIFDLGRNQPRPQHASSRHNGLSCLLLTILYDLVRFD